MTKHIAPATGANRAIKNVPCNHLYISNRTAALSFPDTKSSPDK